MSYRVVFEVCEVGVRVLSGALVFVGSFGVVREGRGVIFLEKIIAGRLFLYLRFLNLIICL